MTNIEFPSVWDAIEDTSAQAENMKLRSSLMIEISEHIKTNGLTQKEAAQLFAVTQPRISDLVRGKINLFSIDTLVSMLFAAGRRVELSVAPPASRKRPRRRLESEATLKPAHRKEATMSSL